MVESYYTNFKRQVEIVFEKPEKENIECHFTSFWVAPRMATLCITAAHRRWVKFRGSKRRAKTFASSLVKHSCRFSQKVIKNQPFRMLLGSAHQMGTARIHPDAKQGVVDLNGKVHGLDNVYIVDSSTFPRCSGVNPMITIQSMSHFLVSQI